MEPSKLSDRELVVACLSPTQATIEISDGAHHQARLLCDGLCNLIDDSEDYLYDWSHVRDSSDEAIEMCATYLRRYLRMSNLVDTANQALAKGDVGAYNKAIGAIMARE